MANQSKILIDSDISIAKTMPSKFYLSDEYFNEIIIMGLFLMEKVLSGNRFGLF